MRPLERRARSVAFLFGGVRRASRLRTRRRRLTLRSVRVRPTRGLATATLVFAVLASLGPADGSTSAVGAAAGRSRILYASDWSGRMQIYAVDPERQAATAQLTFGGDGFVDPLPSPDGRHLAYRASSSFLWERSHDLWVARANGSAARRVAIGAVGDVAWSPDSRLLAYRVDQMVHLVRFDGSSDRVVAGAPSWMPTPGMSPDGKWRAAPVLRNGRVIAIEVTPADGGTTRVFEATSAPRWSPDSRRLAFTRAHGTYVVTPPAARVRRLTKRTGVELAWSPDGRSLAFREGREGSEPTSAYTSISGDLVVAALAGRARTVVGADKPHGGRILGVAWTRPPEGVRYRAARLAPPARISPTSLLAGGPISRLAADGQRVAFVSCEGVFAWTPATGEVARLRDSDALSTCRMRDRYWVGYALALAGDHVAYGELQGCHTIRVTLRLEALAPPRGSSELASGQGACGSRYTPGVGWTAGAGDLLVFSSWTEGCPPGSCSSTLFGTTRQEVLRVGREGCPCPVIASSPGPLIPADVDGGRVVVHGDNETLLLARDGRQLLSLGVSPLTAQLSGSDLVLVRRGEILHHDARRATLLHRWPLPDVPAGARCEHRCAREGEAPQLLIEDLARGLVTYVLAGRIHLLRLADGADTIISRGTHARFLDAGLVYADGSRLRLVPFDRLPLR
jgi:WD40-like Beta Propeller Repeat